MSTDNPYAPPTAELADFATGPLAATPFFAVSIRKLVLMSVFTAGFYVVFWFYRNWRCIKAWDRSNISPAARALFSLFYCYACFKRVRDFEVSGVAASKLAAGLLTTAWILLSLAQQVPHVALVLAPVTVLCFVPVQRRANLVNQAVQPAHDPNDRFSVWNGLAFVLGALVYLGALLNAFLPPE